MNIFEVCYEKHNRMEQPKKGSGRTLQEKWESEEYIKARVEELQKESQERIRKASTKTLEPFSLKTAFVIIIIFCLIAFPIAYQCKKNRLAAPTEEEIKMNCAVLAENGVKANLKAPTTAEFNYSSGNYNDYVQLISVADSTFEVNGTRVSTFEQNGFSVRCIKD